MTRKLFLCPPDAPAGNFTRCVVVPASQEWLAVYNAALLMLANPYLWEQVHPTDITPEQAAERAMLVYEQWLAGDCSLDCEDVLACLQPVLDDLLRQGAINPNALDPTDNTVVETRFPASRRDDEILPPPSGCDPDILWSGVLEIVERIDQNGRDFWETIVAEVDTIERMAQIIALVPLFGDLVGEGLLLLTEIAPDMVNQYNSYSSQGNIEAIACDLFCSVKNDCRYPTYQEVYDYLSGRSALGAQAWASVAFDAMVDFLVGANGVGDSLVWFTTNILQMWVLAVGAKFVRTVGVEYIALWAQIGSAIPSSAWSLICDDCQGITWEADFDFTIDQQGWSIASGRGQWTASGIAGTQVGNQYFLQVQHTWGGPWNITNLVAKFTSANIHNATFSAGMRDTPGGSPYDFIISESAVGEEPHDMEFDGDIDRTGPLLFVFGGNNNNQIYLTSIHMEGNGPDPFA